MKRILSLSLMLIFALTMSAQKEVTKFLGIPVDGSKSEMIQKIRAKGFTYNNNGDYLEGEFNGTNVQVYVVTHNRMVYRVLVVDDTEQNEANIKIRYNNLCRQFQANKKYMSLVEDQSLSNDEKISYEMNVHNKRYEASFYQLSLNEAANEAEDIANRNVWFMIDGKYGQYRIAMYYDNKYNQANGEDL